jgi:hypothetical protein
MKIKHMALTRDFRETIRSRVKRDPGFRNVLFREGVENLLAGDVETGEIILRDFSWPGRKKRDSSLRSPTLRRSEG